MNGIISYPTGSISTHYDSSENDMIVRIYKQDKKHVVIHMHIYYDNDTSMIVSAGGNTFRNDYFSDKLFFTIRDALDRYLAFNEPEVNTVLSILESLGFELIN